MTRPNLSRASLLRYLVLLFLFALPASILATGVLPTHARSFAAQPTLFAAANMPLDAGLHARFNAALGQVEGKLVRLVAAAPLLVVAAAIILLSVWLGRLVSRRRGWLRLRSHNPYMDDLVRRVVHLFVLLAGILVALDLLGATSLVGAVLGSAGVIGLVLGFAFKDIAENYVSGILLSLRRPFSPGDHVVIDSHEGKVVALDSRATTLMTLDGNQLRLPNALVFKSVMLNYSANPNRRFDFSLVIEASESIQRTQGIALATMAAVDGVLSDPPPSTLVEEYAAAGITLRVFGWIDQHGSDFNKVRSESIRRVKAKMVNAGIKPPRATSYLVMEQTDPAPPNGNGEAGAADTSVNHEMDQQLDAAQRASNDNLLQGGTPDSEKPAQAPPR